MVPIKSRFPARIATARLVLEAPRAAHASAIAQLANNPRIHSVMARLPFPYTLEDAHFFLEQVVPSETELCYAILLGGETFMGVVGLTWDDKDAPSLGYWLGEPHWGHGYATEAALAVVQAAREIGLAALKSRALQTNTASQKVLLKSGFTPMGEATDDKGNLAGRQVVLMRQEFEP